MSSAAQKQLKEHAKTIKECIAKQDYKEALEELNKAIKLDPSNFNMYLYSGFCLSKLLLSEGDNQYFTQAEQAYEKACSLQKDSEQPLLGLAELYENKKLNASLRKKALVVYEKLNQILKTKDDEKWYNNMVRYHQAFSEEVRSISEAELSGCIIKFETLVNDMNSLLESRKTSNLLNIRYSYMLDLLFVEQWKELQNVDKMLDQKIQIHIEELRDKHKKKLLKDKKKLSEKELEKLMPKDIELLPMNKREELKLSWKEETTQQYYSQNLETSVDKMLGKILDYCKTNHLYCDFYVFDKIIGRTQKRFKLVQDTSIEKKLKLFLISTCKDALTMHKNYFKAIETLFFLNEEDDYNVFDEKFQEQVLTKRILHLFPFEGLSHIKLFDLFRKQKIKDDKIEDELIVLLQKGIDMIPQYIQGWILLAELYISMEKFKNASEVAKRALVILEEREASTKASLKKQKLNLSLLQGHALRKFGALADAEQIFMDVLNNVDANNLDALKGIAEIEYYRGNHEKSREYYLKAIQINPLDDQTLCQTGWFSYLDKDYEAAEKFIKQAIEVNPNDYMYHYKLARVYWDWNDSYKADKQYCFSLFLNSAKLNPNYSSNYAYLGHYYQDIEKDEERCIKCYKKAVLLNPLEDEAGSKLGDIYIKKGQLTLAASLFKDATSRNNRAGWAWSKLGFYQQSQNMLDESILSFQHALRVKPQDALCWEGLGESYKQEGKYLAALKAFSRAIELDPSLVFSMVQSAYIKFQLSEFDDSIDIYEKVISINEKYVVAYKGISEVLFKISKNLFEDGLFTKSVHQLIRAQCVLKYGINKGFDTGMRTLWKAIADLQSYMFFLPEKNVVEGVLSFKETMKGLNPIHNETFNESLQTKLDYLKEASHSYSVLRSLDETDSDSWYDLGVSQIYQIFNMSSGSEITDLKSSAIQNIRKAITLNPHQSQYWNSLGIISDNVIVKQHCFIRSTQLDNKNHVAWNNLGALYLSSGDLKLARKAFLKAQAIFPESSIAWVGLALINENVLTKEGVTRAKEDFKHSTTLENVPSAYLGLGYSSLLTNDSVFAVQSIMKYFQFNTTEYAAWNVLGVALELQQHYERAVEAYNKCEGLLLDTQIKSSAAKKESSHKGFMEGTPTIVFDEKDLYSIDNMLYLVRINKARALCKLSRFNEASAVFELCKNFNTDDMGIVVGSAVTSCFASDFSFSIKSIQSAIESTTKKIKQGEENQSKLIELYNLLAKVYYQQKDYKKSKEYFEKWYVLFSV